MVKFLKEQKGLGYRRISHILFTKGYRTVRSKKPIMNNYVYSIYSKGKIRENRIERSFESTLTDLNCTIKEFSKRTYLESNRYHPILPFLTTLP